jgi:RNA polymerase sigma-70 factor (ECF subfamily)
MWRMDTVTHNAASEEEFRRLVEPHRAELHAHCYRMLGSVHDAEDALQDALLRAWRALPRFEGRSSLRTWLYRIATNTSLDLIARRPRRVLPIDLGPPADPHDEPAWLEPYPDEQLGVEDGPAAPDARYERRESVELAFVAAVQHLAPNQRAALILRDVLGFSAGEVAETLGTTVASVNSAMQRARAAVEARTPERSQQAALRALGDAQLRDLVERYMDAMERGDVDAIVDLLAADASWSMPPYPAFYRGRDEIVGFLHSGPLKVRWRHLPAHANGQPAVACYAWSDERARYDAWVLDVFTLDGPRIAAVTSFITPEIFTSFGLPAALPA